MTGMDAADAVLGNVSTAHLPQATVVESLLREGHRRFRELAAGEVADYIPFLAQTPPDLFGACIVGADGHVFEVGDATYPFSIQTSDRNCARVLAVMATAGLYEQSGSWMYEVVLPGRSGVSGGIVTVSPGKGGLGTFSPRLDVAGNSIRGQLLTRYLSERLGLNIYASTVVNRS